MTPSPGQPPFLTTTEELEDLCDEVLEEEAYAFDTEFQSERTYFPRLALIQLGWADKVALIDPLAVDPTPLGRLFEGPGIGVAHAAGQDLEILKSACGASPTVVFDTQVVAGFLGLSTPSLGRLVEHVLDVKLSKSDQLSDWLARPLSDRQLSYAASDVSYLLEIRRRMTAELDSRGRLDWALEECARLQAVHEHQPVPEERWWKVADVRKVNGRARGIAQEVTAWREGQAAALNRPRRSILPDLAIVTIAQRAPRSKGELESLRGVESRYLAKGAGAEILEAVERGRSLSEQDLRLPPEAPESRAPRTAVAICEGVVRSVSKEQQIDQSLLATNKDIARLTIGEPSRLDDGWRAQLVGHTLRKLLAGELSVALGKSGELIIEERLTPPQ